MTMKRSSREPDDGRPVRSDGHDQRHHDAHHETHHDGHRRVTRRPGRPRSEAAERAIVDAVLDLLAEGVPYGVLSVEQIATRAGVGKATLYRRWANKESLVVNAMASLFVDCPMPDLTGGPDFRDLLVDALRNVATGLSAERSGLVFSAVMAEGLRHPELVRRYQETVIEPRRDVMRVILRYGIETGAVRSDLDVERGLRLVVAPVLTFLKNEHLGEDVPEEVVHAFIDGVVDDVLYGMTPRP